MFAKISVKGEDQNELYKFLTSKETNPNFAGDISWNFNKFLINRKGEIVARFSSKDTPQSEAVKQAIEKELQNKK
jgi:glutathione peroxidase